MTLQCFAKDFDGLLGHEKCQFFISRFFPEIGEDKPRKTDILTRSATLMSCMQRMENETLFKVANHLVIHAVGSDHLEGVEPEESLPVFALLFEFLDISEMEILLCGPTLHATPETQSKQHEVHYTTSDGKECKLILHYQSKYYHDIINEYSNADLIVGFNAGIWGYESWLPTVQAIKDLEKPFLITSYNKEESIDDLDAIEYPLDLEGKWIWEVEEAPFGALSCRESRSSYCGELHENSWWQLVWNNAPRK
eukprot:TRINITY_DN156293_c0_g1_i1.p1 TRINITY_DN156293_c0_g1~~TRINITY_DN156293_c0_g1_i1.p1  ORF type:complete len:252 (+),score=60.14 TRINITY_DN156293_c0_g1_i1:35-790(+)